MASSRAYWGAAEEVAAAVGRLKEKADEIYSELEGSDDVGELADNLESLSGSLDSLVGDITAMLDPLRAADKALQEVEGGKKNGKS